MNRIGLKAVCLVASIVIWMQVAATSVVEQSANLPLQVTGLEQGLTVEGSPLPEKVSVRLKGSKLRLLAHKYLNKYLGEVRINLSDQSAGPPFSYEIDRGDVFTDLAVVNIFPPVRLRLNVDRVLTRLVDVELETTGELPSGWAFLEVPKVVPDSVAVTGPSRFFFPETKVSTLQVDLSHVKESQDFPVALVPPHPHLHLEHPEVHVSLKVAPLEERTLANIPVIPLVDAGQPEVGVSPPVVDVMVRGVADSIRTLDRSRFLVTVPVGGLGEGIYTLAGQVEFPPWLTLIGLDPAEFQVIVGSPVFPGEGPDQIPAAGSLPDSTGGGDGLD